MRESRAPALASEIPVNGNLTLRSLNDEHIEQLWRIIQVAPEVQSYITWTAGVSELDEMQQAVEQQCAQYEEAPYVLEDAQGVVGYVSARNSLAIAHEYEFGYFLTPAIRGRGYIPAAIGALMFAAKQELAARSFALYINDDNAASQAVAGKLEFKATEEFRVDEVLHCLERRYERVA